MRKYTLIVAVNILIFFIAVPAFSQQLTWRMTNPTISNSGGIDYLVYDIEVKCSVANTFLAGYTAVLGFDVTAFVDAVTSDVAVTKGSHYATLNPNGNPKYLTGLGLSGAAGTRRLTLTLVTNDNGGNPGGPTWFEESLTTWHTVFRVTMKIENNTKAAWLFFRTGAMTGTYRALGSTSVVNYLPPHLADAKDMRGLYLGRIFSNLYGWSQVGGTVNWATTLNTSVWDNIGVLNTAGALATKLRIHESSASLPGGQLEIVPPGQLTVSDSTIIAGPQGLWLSSNATGNGSFIDNGPVIYPNSGSAKADLFLTSCAGQTEAMRCWHYVTQPVVSALAGTFNGDYLKSYDEPITAWSAYFTHSATPLVNLQGYAVSAQGDGVRTFSGILNTGDLTTTPALTRTGSKTYGWNLVGNPYSSPIDINSTGITWTNVDKKVYYLDQSAGNYMVYPIGVDYGTGTQFPLSMQGFFVYVNSPFTSGSIKFTNAARTMNSDVNSQFYKNSVPDLLRLKTEGNNGMSDQMLICFRPDATEGYDADFDCFKLYGDKEAPQLYSVTSGASSLTINSLPFAGLNTIVPLEFSVDSNGTGSYSITASNLESFQTGTTVILEDKKETITQDLTLNPVYAFNYADGDDAARFLLHFYNPSFGINEPGKNNDLRIYSFGNDIYVKDLTGSPAKGEFFLYDVMGKKITQKPVAGISLNKYTFNLPEGYYLVRVVTNDKTYNGKVYLD